MSRHRVAALFAAVIGLAAASGCAAGGQAAAEGPPTPPGTARVVPAGCGDIPLTGGRTIVDYADFVQAHGTTYIAGLRGRRTVSSDDLGDVQFRVRCSLSELNEQTHRIPHAVRDRDAAFLAHRTPVYAIHGWSPTCRLAAKHDGQWHVYLAYGPGPDGIVAKKCALHHQR